jgi:hypothetical protein
MRPPFAVLLALSLSSAAFAGDWTNSGGDAGRNGRTSELGPDATDLLWSGGRSSIIAWQPVIAGQRVFVIRQSSFPPETTGSPIVAMDLNDGHELWHRDVPVNTPQDWTAWIAGVSNGQVYAARSGNGASVTGHLFAYDQVTGNPTWPNGSADLIDAGAYDGVVFAANGDPIIASFRTIWRIRATDGTTAWSAPRIGSVSGNCGGALGATGFYIADVVAGGMVIKKFNPDTGAFMYQSPLMAGFTVQNTPMVAPDGTIYLSRVQNNASVDFFFAINDDGSAMTIRWSQPAAYSTASEFSVALDNSVYMWAPGNFIQRRAAADGSLIGQTASTIPADFAAPRMGVDSGGRLFFSNGAFNNGEFYSFNADLTPRWSIAVPNINIGAPAIGSNGTLVIAGIGANIFAYRTPRPHCGTADFNCDGAVGTDADIESFFACLSGMCPPPPCTSTADFNGDGATGTDADIESFFRVLSGGPC